jgi:hypothetical protein
MSNNRRDFLKLTTLCLTAPVGTSLAGIAGNNQQVPAPEKAAGQAEKMNYQPWLWIELIGFDNEKKDFGVAAFLENTGFVPEAISFLICDPDFVHAHRPMDEEWVFPPQYCSYSGRPFSRERSRQPWTNLQLRGLVAELHKHGVAAYCSFFDFVIGGEGSGKWSKDHPEVYETSRDGVPYNIIHPLKRLKNKTFYKDFFLDKLGQMMKDYGFAGLHVADGYSSGRRPLDDVDYSDDMVEQFTTHAGVKLPADLPLLCDDDKPLFGKRSRWIWKNKRKDWIHFHEDLWVDFYQKLVDKMHAMDRKIVFNTAWTRAPFEALYRYGINYHRLAQTGMDGFVVEAAASAVAMEPNLSQDHEVFHYNSMAMLMLIKAQAPNTALRPFTGISDTLEQYDALRHVPTVVEREIYSMANLYLNDGAKLTPCSSGPLCCLSDSVEKHEWSWLKQRWDLGFSVLPQSVVGATLIWSEAAFNNQLADYIQTRRWSTHKLLFQLLALGAPVGSVANVKDLGKLNGPILVLNPHLLPTAERGEILKYQQGPVILIGGKTPSVPGQSMWFEDGTGPESLACTVIGKTVAVAPDIKNQPAEKLPAEIPEPFSWTENLYFRKVSKEFLTKCAQVITNISEAPKVVAAPKHVRLMTYHLRENVNRILIGSDSFYYETPSVDMGRLIKKIDVKTPFPGVPVVFDKSKLTVRIPGKGMVILDVHYS